MAEEEFVLEGVTSRAAPAQPTDTTIVFEVLEGPEAGRRIVLSGRKMPTRGSSGGTVSYEAEQHTVLTWYPGNPVASQQVLGARELPTQFNGVWSDRYLGPGQAKALSEAFFRILRTGVQVLVVWDVFVRQGLVRKFKITPGTPTGGSGDLGWEMTCEWNRAVDRAAPALFPDFDLQTNVVVSSEAIARYKAEVEEKTSDITYQFGMASQSLSAAVAGIVVDLEELGRLSEQLADVGARLADSMVAKEVEAAIALSGASLVRAAALGATFGDLFHGTVSPSDSMAAVVGVALLRADVVDASVEVIDRSWSVQSQAEKIARPQVYATIVAVPGSDLRRVAIRYYGDADLWSRIAKANGLESSIVPAGIREIVVPLDLNSSMDDRDPSPRRRVK